MGVYGGEVKSLFGLLQVVRLEQANLLVILVDKLEML
jgi:hypothetical protein